MYCNIFCPSLVVHSIEEYETNNSKFKIDKIKIYEDDYENELNNIKHMNKIKRMYGCPNEDITPLQSFLTLSMSSFCFSNTLRECFKDSSSKIESSLSLCCLCSILF